MGERVYISADPCEHCGALRGDHHCIEVLTSRAKRVKAEADKAMKRYRELRAQIRRLRRGRKQVEDAD